MFYPHVYYLGFIEQQGFHNITIQKEKPITIPNDILEKYLTTEQMDSFQNGNTGIFSVTVFAEKPGVKTSKIKVKIADLNSSSNACTPESGCC